MHEAHDGFAWMLDRATLAKTLEETCYYLSRHIEAHLKKRLEATDAFVLDEDLWFCHDLFKLYRAIPPRKRPVGIDEDALEIFSSTFWSLSRRSWLAADELCRSRKAVLGAADALWRIDAALMAAA